MCFNGLAYCLSAEGGVVKGPAPKKQKQEKQRSRKEKASQHNFSHQLLAASLKVNWNTHTDTVNADLIKDCICFIFSYIKWCVILGSFQKCPLSMCVFFLPISFRATVGTWHVLISAVMGSIWHHALMTEPSASGAPKTFWTGNTSAWGPTWSWIMQH